MKFQQISKFDDRMMTGCSHGSVHQELVALRREKEAAEKLKMQSLQDSITTEKQNSIVEELKKIDASEETVRKVEQSLENDAKTRMEAIQGQYYETYD